jgi:deazaflavin-dependent oxidoreductase (nitroreductase family)
MGNRGGGAEGRSAGDRLARHPGLEDPMPDMNDMNRKIIEEFRASSGRVGGPFEGSPMVLLHTTGAKSGQARVNPLVYQRVGDDIAVFGSKGGAPTSPDWYHNLRANPRATVEVGSDTYEVKARVAEGGERDRIWAQQKQDMPGFADYEKATTRTIPVIILERVG